MGYFRLFYYISYTLNFILRVLKRHGKGILFFICVAVFLVVCMYNPQAQAAYIADFDYADPNYALYKDYDSTLIDMIKRLENLSSSYDSVKEQFLTLIKSNNMGYFAYYATENNNSQNLNGTFLNTGSLRVMLYYRNINYINRDSAPYDNYRGVDTSVHNITFGNYVLFAFGLSNLSVLSTSSSLTDNPQSVYVPDILYSYNSEVYNYYFVNNYSIEEIEILREMDNKISTVTNTIQETQDYLTEEPSSSDFSSSDLPSSSGVVDTTEEGLGNIFTQFYTAFCAEPNVRQLYSYSYTFYTVRVFIWFIVILHKC